MHLNQTTELHPQHSVKINKFSNGLIISFACVEAETKSNGYKAIDLQDF